MNDRNDITIKHVPVAVGYQDTLKNLILRLLQEAKVTKSCDPKLHYIVTEIFAGMRTSDVAYYYSAFVLDRNESPDFSPRDALCRHMLAWAKNCVDGLVVE